MIKQRPVVDINVRQHKITLRSHTLIMGIVNCTPDSFSKDGKWISNKDSTTCIRHALSLIHQGAGMIDIGGESTRPGAKKVSVAVELDRVIPTILALAQKTSVPISIDTYKPQVAQAALEAGASIVNSVRGTQVSKSLLSIVRRFDAGIVLMHSRGTSSTMMRYAHYKDIMKDILAELTVSVKKCLDSGIKKDKIIIDPGIGFAKTTQHNLEILRRLSELHALGCTILIGPSRKSFIGQVLQSEVHHRLWGTAATISASILNGAHIVRVHDVHEMKDVVDMTDAIIYGIKQ